MRVNHGRLGDCHRHVVDVHVERDVEIVVLERNFVPLDSFRLSSEPEGKEAVHLLPVRHSAVKVEPGNVRRVVVLGRGGTTEKTVPLEHGMACPERDELFHEIKHGGVVFNIVPVEPGYFVVLAVGVVVSVLRATHLVACDEHRRALGHEERGEKVLDLARSRALDFRV